MATSTFTIKGDIVSGAGRLAATLSCKAFRTETVAAELGRAKTDLTVEDPIALMVLG